MVSLDGMRNYRLYAAKVVDVMIHEIKTWTFTFYNDLQKVTAYCYLINNGQQVENLKS